jgi:hypothetical protein
MASTMEAALHAVAGTRLDFIVGYSIVPPSARPTEPAVAAAFADFDGRELRRLARQLASRQHCHVTEADDAVQDAVMEIWRTRPDLLRQPAEGWLGLLYEVARRNLGAIGAVSSPLSVEAELEKGDRHLADARPCSAESHRAEEECRYTAAPRVGEAWNREQLLGAIQRFRDYYGRAPKVTEFRAIHALPSTSVLYRHFESLADALLCAGLVPDAPVNGRRKWPPLVVARECRSFRRRNLRWPGWHDVKRRRGDLPSTSVMIRCFGGTREIDVQLGAEAILAAVGEPTA